MRCSLVSFYQGLFLRVDSGWNISESPDMRLSDYNDSRWRRVTLPHDWGVELPMSPDKGSCQGYLSGGIGWYRRHFSLTPTKGKHYFIYFEGIYNHSEVYLNGNMLGKRPSGFISMLYDMTPYLKDGENVLAVRVDHSAEADSRWYTGSGINRNVWMVTAPQIHLAQWGTAYRLKNISSKKAVVEVDVETADEREKNLVTPTSMQAVVELVNTEGKVVSTSQTSIGTQEKKTLTLSVPSPKRWELATPYLYTLITRLIVDGKERAKSKLTNKIYYFCH